MANHLDALRNIDSPNISQLVSNLPAEILENERALLTNDYPQDRGIFTRGSIDNTSHFDFFGDSYIDQLKNFTEQDLWLHVGPGDFHAEVDYFTSSLFSQHAHVVSNAYRLSESDVAKDNLKILQPFKEQGKFTCIGDIKFQELQYSYPGKATLISDVFAAASYDPDLFGVFKAASEILRPGGMFAVVLLSVTFKSLSGTPIPASEYYEGIKGFKIINHTDNGGWVFQRTNDTFDAPSIILLSFIARDKDKKVYWPMRKYQIGS